MPPKGRRPPPAEEGSKTDWGHPDGCLLEEIEVDEYYEGTVTNVSPYGVFVDFGAVKDGLLRVPIASKRAYKKGMEVKNLKCISCDADAGKVVLVPDEVPEPPPKKPPAEAKAKAKAKAKTKAKAKAKAEKNDDGEAKPAKAKKSWDHPEARQLEELSEGDVVSGTVTNVSPAGVFLDIGFVKDARLSVPTRIGRRFRREDKVEEATVESIDVEKGRVSVVLADAEAVVADLPPKERAPKAQAKPKSKAEAKSQPKAKAKPKAKQAPKAQPAREGAVPIEELEVGALVDGIVSNKSPAGVFVNIGCEKDARLNVPRKIGVQFRRGDEICGMTIDSVDVEKNQISVSLEDPELEVQEPEPKPAAKRKAKAEPAPEPKAKAKAAAAEGKAKAKAKAKAAAPAAEAPAAKRKGLPVSKFRKGGTADGIVTQVTSRGVFVDIGAVTDGLLKISRAIAKQMAVGDEVHGMEVEEVDKEGERVILSLDEPALEEPPPPAPRPKPKPKPKAKPEAKTAAGPPRQGGSRGGGKGGGKGGGRGGRGGGR